MKEGYKKTELGWIPVDWKLDNINNVTYLNPESLSNSTDDNLIINYIDIESVKPGKVLGYKEFGFSEAPSRARRVVVKNDVIVSTVRPNLKSVAKINFDKENLICSTGFAVLRKKESVDSDYLFQFAMSDIFTKQLVDKTVGSNYPAVNSTDIKEILIFIPQLKEQQKIAEILSTVDSQIDDTDKLIEKTKKLKKGLMYRLLTKGIGHTEFNMTEIGEIPVEWDVRKLGDIGEVVMGQSPVGNSYNDEGIGIPLLNGPTEFTAKYPIPKQWTTKSTKICNENDILFCVRGSSVGRMNISDNKYCIGRGLAAIREKDGETVTAYLYYILQKFINGILNLSAGSTFPNVGKDDLNSLLCAIPPLKEQQKISDILSSVDTQIEEYENKKAKLEELKKALMQQLLTGKIRVKV